MDLNDVKIGDVLMCTSGRSFNGYLTLKLRKVLRETKTQLILEKNTRIKKDTGKELGTGSQWNSANYWRKYDQEEVLKIRERNLELDVKSAKKELGRKYNKKVLIRLLEDLESED